MSKPAREAVQAIIAHGLAKTLKERGFEVKDTNFRRIRAPAGAQDVVRVPVDDVYGPTGSFVVSVGVYHAKIAALLGQDPLERPLDVECTVRKRFGPTDAGGTLAAWKIGDKSKVPVVSDEVVNVWRTAVDPWLARVGDLVTLHRALDAGTVKLPDPLASVAVALLANDKPVAQQRLDKIMGEITDEDELEGSIGATILAAARKLAAQHGLVARAEA